MNPTLASLLGRFDELKSFIGQDPNNIHFQDDFGDSPLHAAAQKGRSDIVKYLLNHGANPNLQNKSGSTPLHKCAIAKFDQFEIIRYLLNKDANVNIPNNSGYLPEDLTGDLKIKEILMGSAAVTIHVSIPKDLHGRIIGKEGSKLKEIKTQTKTMITIPPPEEKTNNITIKGRADSVQQAKRRILQAAQQQTVFEGTGNNEVSTSGDEITSKVRINKEKHKVLVGRAGKTIKSIVGDFNVQVNIPPFDDPEDQISISGPIEQVNTVIKRINEHIAPKPRSAFGNNSPPTTHAQLLNYIRGDERPRRGGQNTSPQNNSGPRRTGGNRDQGNGNNNQKQQKNPAVKSTQN